MPYEYQDQQNLSIIAMTTKAQTVTIENYCIVLQTLPSLYTFTYQYNVFSRISSIQSAGQRHNYLNGHKDIKRWIRMVIITMICSDSNNDHNWS